MLQTLELLETSPTPFRVGAALPADEFWHIRRRMILDYCKWDPQVGDVGALAPFPLMLRRQAWKQLARWAEALAAEAIEAERELLYRPELFAYLGIGRPLRRALRQAANVGATPSAGRIIRFDFHWTTDGWRISEANADVPGGFTESSSFARIMAEHYQGALPAGDPARKWADVIARAAGPGGKVALLVATGYMEDQQIVSYLANELGRRGVAAHLCLPSQLVWSGRRAWLATAWYDGPLDAVIRFYQAEWFGAPFRACGAGWQLLFGGGDTPAANPGSSILIESKRFPLAWDVLSTSLPTWRRLLPRTVDPRYANWHSDNQWVLKAAFSNNGDETAVRPMAGAQWRRFCRAVTWRPGAWVAQRRFETIPIHTPLGSMLPCMGVYTIDGVAAGIYGRLSRGAVTDYSAIDVAVLVEPEEDSDDDAEVL